MKMAKAIDTFVALQAIGQEKLKGGVSLRIGRALNMLQPEIKLFEEERTKLAKELGEPQENGSYKFSDENIIVFNDKVNELMNEEIDITLPTISEEEVSEMTVEPSALAVLDGIMIK